MLFRVGRKFESRRSVAVVRVGPGEVNDIERRTHVIPVQFAVVLSTRRSSGRVCYRDWVSSHIKSAVFQEGGWE